MIVVKCIKPFFDLESNCDRVEGSSWEVEIVRANILNSKGLIECEFPTIEDVKPTEDKSFKPSLKKK